MNNPKKFLGGQVMIESLIAISIGMFGLLGILTLVSRSISLQNDLSQQFTANYLAAEGVELVRSNIDAFYNPLATDPWGDAKNGFGLGRYQISYDGIWQVFSGSSPTGLDFLSLKGGLYGYFEPGAGVSETIFKRQVEVVRSDDIKIQIIATVFWESRGEEKTVVLEDSFYNWR
jgi:hypothetical protein